MISEFQTKIQTAAEILKNGSIVCIPTETVYGLAGNATSDHAIKKIYNLKKRPANNPLISHYPSIEAAKQDVIFPPAAEKIAQEFWPGSLTMVLEKTRNSRISDLATAGLSTAAVRIPNHPVAIELLQQLPFPLAAPSANLSGAVSPVTAEQAQKIDRNILVLDGGRCSVGIESTIVQVSDNSYSILRHGGITNEDIAAALSELTTHSIYNNSENTVLAPGMMYKHYAPSCSVIKNVLKHGCGNKDALLSFGNCKYTNYSYQLNLSPTGNLHEAAKNLFHFMHILDDLGAKTISISPIPNEGIGAAINDKIDRAASH